MTLSAPADPRQIASFPEFYRSLEQHLARPQQGALQALLAVSLRRSDRLAALLGEAASMEASRQIAARVAAILRPQDRFVMDGHEECWLLLPDLASQELAVLALHRLLAALRQPIAVQHRTVFVHPVVGIACTPCHADHAQSWLRAADMAQQQARADHDTHAVAPLLSESDRRPDNLEIALGRMLRENALTVAYQPLVDMASGRPVAVEALVRWPETDSEYIPASLLIETAERMGQIETLTLHVINTVLRTVEKWRRHDFNIPVWINLSARMLAQADLPSMLAQLLGVWNAPRGAIGFEITESALIRDISHSTDIMFELQQMGFALAIDDFGTGYSSLAYLRRFPVSELKIDRVFVAGMATSPADRQIVQSIIDLGHNFGLKVVAEGVEDEQTLPQLRAMGCDLVQGYVHARPMSGEALPAWWRDFQERAARS